MNSLTSPVRPNDSPQSNAEAFLRAVLDGQTAHIAIVDAQGNITQTNAAWDRFWEANGGPSTHCRDVNYLEACERATGPCRSDACKVAQSIRRVLDGQSAFESLVYPCHAPNEERWFSVVVTPLGQSMPGAVVAHYNITDQVLSKKALEAVNEENRRLALVARETTNAVVMTDANRRITYVNDGFTRITGFAAHEVIGKTPSSILQFEKTCPKTILQMRRCLDAQVPFRGEILNRGKDGREYWLDIDIQPQFDEHNRLSGFMAIESDITTLVVARERAEKALREIGALRSALDEHSLMSITDRQGTILDVNTGFCRISGYTREELVGQNHRIINSGAHPKSFWANMWGTIASGRAWRGEVCNRKKDGSLYWVDSTIVPYLDAHGRIEKYVSIRFDITQTKRNQQALADAQALLEQTGRVARVGGWQLDLSSMQPIWSDQVYRIHELPSGQQIPLEDGINFYAPEARPKIRQAVREAIEQGKSFDLELPFITARGRHLWVRSIGIAEMVEGRCVKLWGAFQDITEQRQARVKLQSMAQRLRTATDGAGVGVWEYVPDTGELIWDQTIYKLYGMEPGTTAGTYAMWRDSLHPDDLADTEARLIHTINSGEKFETTFRIRRGDGQTRYIQAGAVVVNDPLHRQKRLLGVNTDITPLRVAQERLSLAMNAANIGLWDWDITSGNTFFSDRFYTMLGYGPEELPMHVSTWEALCHPDDLHRARQHLKDHFEGLTDLYHFEHRLRTRDGSWLWIRDVGQIVERDTQGRPLRMIGVHIDVDQLTRTRQTIEQLNTDLLVQTVRANDMAAEAEQANQIKSLFLANMSHEIRTPLTAILGYTDILSKDGDTLDVNQKRNALSTIQRAGQHLLAVINDVLDISKIEAGRMTIEQVPTAIGRLLLEVDSLLKPRAQSKGVRLTTSLLTPIPDRIMSDPTRLRQILMNIIGNAAKFTMRGSIEVRAGQSVDGSTLRVEVQDTGPGLEREQSKRLFEAFSQADSSITRKHGGTGLGLTISRRLAELMGGGVELSWTKPGEGSCFVVELPLRPAEGSTMIHTLGSCMPDTLTRQVISRRMLRGRILLAEDGADNQRLIGFFLRKAGAEVDIADDGQMALAMISNATQRGAGYDLIISDMQMPQMDGYSLASTLRGQGQSIPIIALTAHAMAEDRQRCIEAGCDEYASKPIDRDALIDLCARWIGCDGASCDDRTTVISGPWEDALVSQLAGDEDLQELIEQFSRDLADRAQAMGELMRAGDLEPLRQLVHQLKGSAGGYGYPAISHVAMEVEQLIKSRKALSEVAQSVEQLVSLCHRASLGASPTPTASAVHPTDDVT